VRNLAEKTGKSLDEWIAIARSSGLNKHKEMLNYLKDEHGLTYGYANLVTLSAQEQMKAEASGIQTGEIDLVADQYAGEKAGLLPIYNALITEVQAFGPDVEIAPKKTYVSLRRNKQFAIFQPTNKTRLDVGINLKGIPPSGRLEASGSFNSMVSHRVRLESLAQVDGELIGWLKKAYGAA
jgi:hypothetical protein